MTKVGEIVDTRGMRVAILGNSGSGKSTLARELAAAIDEPVAMLDLDTIVWVARSGAAALARPPEQALADLEQFCREHATGSWVIEGCYAELIAATLVHQPELILLDPGEQACLAHCRARPWEPHKYASKAEQDSKLEFLLDWVANYYERDGDMSERAHRAVFEAYAGPKRHVTSE